MGFQKQDKYLHGPEEMQVVSETKASGLLDSVSQAGDGTWSLATSDRPEPNSLLKARD